MNCLGYGWSSLSEELICLLTPEIQPIHAIIPAMCNCIHNHSVRETDRNQTLYWSRNRTETTGVGIGIAKVCWSRNRNRKGLLDSESESLKRNRTKVCQSHLYTIVTVDIILYCRMVYITEVRHPPHLVSKDAIVWDEQEINVFSVTKIAKKNLMNMFFQL